MSYTHEDFVDDIERMRSAFVEAQYERSRIDGAMNADGEYTLDREAHARIIAYVTQLERELRKAEADFAAMLVVHDNVVERLEQDNERLNGVVEKLLADAKTHIGWKSARGKDVEDSRLAQSITELEARR